MPVPSPAEADHRISHPVIFSSSGRHRRFEAAISTAAAYNKHLLGTGWNRIEAAIETCDGIHR
jgi:hypothetical protein